MRAATMAVEGRANFVLRHDVASPTGRGCDNCSEFQSLIVAQVDQMIDALQERKQALLQFAEDEKEYKKRVYKEQIARCTAKLAKITGLIQFCIEVLKESDPVAYLQIGSSLMNRVANQELLWHKEMQTRPQTAPDFDLSLDAKQIYVAIQQLNFAQLK
uniref:COS domain-containing protein n=1 Tax=Plectus sambesii TaxID=2011161 RepID=A0A914UQZ3_9BILA